MRNKLGADPKAAERREALRRWQAARLGCSHADLLENPRYRETAEFFLSDIYGPKDLSRHEAEVRRILPLMTKVLPAAGLETVADAIELNALSESLDADMVAVLGDRVFALTNVDYVQAYRAVGRRDDRERQIDIIAHLGRSLDTLTRKSLIGTALAMMRKPALLAGLGDLQNFLERGYKAFRKMKGADDFLATVTSRERALSREWFGEDLAHVESD